MPVARYYFVVRNANRDWHVRAAYIGGGNSEIVETFTTAVAARAFARRKNAASE